MKEQIYDHRISPLMAQIIAICKEHKIAFIADFALDEDLHCTSAGLREDRGPSESQLKAFDLLKPEQHFSLGVMEERMPDGSLKTTIRRIS